MNKLYQFNDTYITEYNIITEFEATAKDSYEQPYTETFFVIQPEDLRSTKYRPEIITKHQILTADYPESTYFLKGFYTESYENAKKCVQMSLDEKIKNLNQIKSNLK
jgi:hypothetical protein